MMGIKIKKILILTIFFVGILFSINYVKADIVVSQPSMTKGCKNFSMSKISHNQTFKSGDSINFSFSMDCLKSHLGFRAYPSSLGTTYPTKCSAFFGLGNILDDRSHGRVVSKYSVGSVGDHSTGAWPLTDVGGGYVRCSGSGTYEFPSLSIVYNAATIYPMFTDYPNRRYPTGLNIGTFGEHIKMSSSPCSLPWGGTIVGGASVPAYAASSVPCGSTCLSETRTCLPNGSLSGSYTKSSCSVGACCTPTTWTPSPSTVYNGVNLTQTSNCGTTRVEPGTKPCPSCTATFNPATVTSPGSSTLTWSSQNTDDIKYTCTGPVPGGADYGSIPLNSPASPAVVFDFPYGSAATESCVFTVKADDGEVGSCTTNAGAGGGGGGGGGGVAVTPHAPTCTLESGEDVVFVGDSTTLTWTSTYASSGEINRSVGSVSPVSGGNKVVYPTVDVTSDITYIGTFTGLGGSTNCSTNSIAVVADPPEILDGSFIVHNTKTGLKPKADWGTNNIVRCDLGSDTGYSKTNACASESACSSIINFEIDWAILEETTYTLTCYNQGGYADSATFTPLGYFEMTAEPTEVEATFSGGGATTEPGIDVGVISWNGYQNSISFTADLSDLPESPGDETTNASTFTHTPLTFSEYFTNEIKSILKIFASYRFTGERTITIWGNETESIDITITSDQDIPIYEPI